VKQEISAGRSENLPGKGARSINPTRVDIEAAKFKWTEVWMNQWTCDGIFDG